MEQVRAGVEAMGGFVKKRYRWNAFLVSAPPGVSSRRFSSAARGIDGVVYAAGNATIHAIGGPLTPSGASAGAASASAVRGTLIPDDPFYPGQWGLPKIGADVAWDTSTGNDVTIGIIDSGIATDQTDFAEGQVVAQRDFVRGDPVANDEYGHGTHVAGIAAAAMGNAAYGCGVAPGAQLVIAKVLDAAGNGDTAAAVDGIRYAVDKGAKIISMSFGTVETPDIAPLSAAVAYARSRGCLVVAAVGNAEGGGFGLTDTVYPAACDGVVGVAASGRTDVVADYSIRALRPSGWSVAVLTAPGTGIESTWYRSIGARGYWNVMTGTSMATPFVSGAAAVIWSKYPWMTPSQVLGTLTKTALDLGTTGRDVDSGYGRIQVDSALSGVDVYESDDTTSAALSASIHAMSAGSARAHTALPVGDMDFHYADLTAGRTYRFWTSRLVGDADTFLTLRSRDGTAVLAENDDVSSGGPASSIIYKPATSGRYLLSNTDTRSVGGGYTINMAVVRAATSITIRSSASSPRYPARFTLSGRLSKGKVGDRYTLQVKKPGSSRWTSLSKSQIHSASASRGGLWRRTYRPLRKGTHSFRVMFSGDVDRVGCWSGTIRVRVG